MAIDKEAIKEHIRGILVALGDDPNREGLKETPDRVAKMYEEVFEGMNYSNHEIAQMFSKTFEDDLSVKDHKDMVIVKDIDIFSYCEHHMALMYDMKVSVAYLPKDKVLGLSKIARICDMVGKRLQLQERDVYKRQPITASDRKEGKYPYYGANGIQDYVNDYIFDDELVLLAEDGGNFGSKEKPIAYRVSGKCWVNNHAHVLKPKEEIDVDYLCYSLMFYKVDGMINGATRKKLTQTAMKKMKIPLRNIVEQKKIVQQLNKIIEIREKAKKELNLLDNLIQARFVELFGDAVYNDKKWETDTVKNLCKEIYGGGTPSKAHPEYYKDGDIPWVSAKDMKTDVLKDSQIKINQLGVDLSLIHIFFLCFYEYLKTFSYKIKNFQAEGCVC